MSKPIAKEISAFGYTPKKMNGKTVYRAKLLLIALPLLALMFVFNYLPLLGWSYAFVEYVPGLSIFHQHFVGFKYFLDIFSSFSSFPTVIRNTLALSLLGILVTPVPIIFAIMLSQARSRKLSRVVQTVSSIPNFVSWILVYAIFFIFFSSQDGMYNRLMMSLHLLNAPTNILGNDSIAWYFQTLVGLWKGTGWGAIIYLSAMTGIDQELYNAASVDGASRFQEIWHITIPGILPTFFVILLLTIANMLSNGFEQYYVFQNPIVIDKLEVFDTYIYRMGIINAQYAFATAMGCFKSVISLILLTVANSLSKVLRGESII